MECEKQANEREKGLILCYSKTEEQTGVTLLVYMCVCGGW